MVGGPHVDEQSVRWDRSKGAYEAVSEPAVAPVPRAPTRRMSKSARRDQLLDTAAALLADGDPGAVTMESVAERAGVSKALPYAHFDNVEHLLVSLYKRSSVELGESIWNALADAGPDDDLAQVWVRAYFQCSVTQGVVFSALIRPGSAIPAKADRHRSAPAFVARILHRFFGVEQSHADAVSGIVQGAFHGGSNTWLHGAVAETLILDVAADVVRGVVVAAPACDRDDHDHPRTPPDSGRAIGNAS